MGCRPGTKYCDAHNTIGNNVNGYLNRCIESLFPEIQLAPDVVVLQTCAHVLGDTGINLLQVITAVQMVNTDLLIYRICVAVPSRKNNYRF